MSIEYNIAYRLKQAEESLEEAYGSLIYVYNILLSYREARERKIAERAMNKVEDALYSVREYKDRFHS